MESVVVSQFLILLIASHLRFTSSLNRLHSKVCCNFWSFMASVLAQSHVLSSCGIDALPSSTTPIGWLSRMIQFKEKSRKLVSFQIYDLISVTYIDLVITYYYHCSFDISVLYHNLLPALTGEEFGWHLINFFRNHH
ncbi:hypothetical protein ES319_A05G047400v1 [Gossypium barbadense]|uniref:Uncharacterized protein n=2 Tax=Gossypium TaxID=3633 RepID=A0A5J5VJJ9_GOSBA|nr:hypothetical protein ES319_A05G047400v1 [Gossypium barbadense]TYH15519.1 hypothetical protein ES288_A05G048400v1 [Gossypium darwinii]